MSSVCLFVVYIVLLLDCLGSVASSGIEGLCAEERRTSKHEMQQRQPTPSPVPENASMYQVLVHSSAVHTD